MLSPFTGTETIELDISMAPSSTSNRIYGHIPVFATGGSKTPFATGEGLDY
jgi:hypothetical protein